MDTIRAWQCIGCSKVEAPQNCVGVCQDRRVELVYATEYAALAIDLARARAGRDACVEVLRRLATLDEVNEAAFHALRDAARRVLAGAALGLEGNAAEVLAPAAGDGREDEPRTRRPATLLVR